MSVIDVASRRIVRSIAVCKGPVNIAFSADSDRVTRNVAVGDAPDDIVVLRS